MEVDVVPLCCSLGVGRTVLTGEDGDLVRRHVDVLDDEWQRSLTDRAEPDDEEPALELDMLGVRWGVREVGQTARQPWGLRCGGGGTSVSR